MMNQLFALAAAKEPVQEAVKNTAEKATESLDFIPMRFVSMLDEMGIGMLVIFILIGVIIGSTLLVNKLFSKKDK
ncbi:MAG: hypothetical protein IJC46_07060 [Clostridia bacterium]|nr:hypothetical protein [Clostridia bacterium]